MVTMDQKRRDIAIQAAISAGEYLQGVFGSDHDIRIKSDKSPVTEADTTSNDLIETIIKSAFPNDQILSEEAPDALTRIIDSAPTWVIDPLDGTSNFIANIPIFAVVIAFVENGEPKLGAIYDPLHNDLFVAQANTGATLNGRPIHVSAQNSTRGAMLFAGRGYKNRDHERHGEIIYALEQQTTYFRRLGCASMMLASVAAGRADSVILTGNSPWDVVAGALLIREAGGQVTDYCGKPWTLESYDLVATNDHLHDELIRITREQDAAKCL
jgi:myo-inositol-1(or 4)-monophosphatase